MFELPFVDELRWYKKTIHIEAIWMEDQEKRAYLRFFVKFKHPFVI